ncbi:MAG TPA: hypothetical protein VGK74_15625 [Symbiobacteriaceae bacterium]|jgi:hypothetical protein
MLGATVRTTVLPEFEVDVYPTDDDRPSARQAYVLILRDGLVGSLELVFPSAQDLQEFLPSTREAFATAKQEAKARKARSRKQPATPFIQVTQF